MASGLYIWAFVQSFILGVTINLVKKSSANYWLASIFIAFAINLALQYTFNFTNIKFEYPRFLFLCDILDFLIPALILTYVDLLVGRKIAKLYWYFVPAALALVILLAYVVPPTEFSFDDYIRTPIHQAVLFSLVVWKLFVFLRLYFLLKKKEVASSIKPPSLLQWARALMIFVGFIGYIAVVQFVQVAFFVPYFTPSLVTQIRALVQLNYVLFSSSIIVATIYFSFKYPKILQNKYAVKPAIPNSFPEEKEYTEKLNKLITEDKVHLNSELDEKALAQHLGIPSYLLSRLLNEHLGKSFSEFINEKRVEAARQMLEDVQNKKLTNFAVAIDSGFRTESVFYVNFKKLTGLTPTQYKNKVKHVNKSAPKRNVYK